MPVIDFHDLDQFGAVIEFLLLRGIPFHTRPPQQLLLSTDDYKALEDANILTSSAPKANGSRGKKTRSSTKR